MQHAFSPLRAWVSALVLASASLAQGSVREPLLAPGPFAVGFRSTWGFDEGRTYRTAFDDGATYGAEKSPRPVLVQMWYPARESTAGRSAAPMPHGRYFAIESDEPRLARLAPALASYARGIFVEQVMGEPESALDERERAELAEALAEPTLCHAGAEPLAGPFPIVVYHCGAGSSFEDNAFLCAWLASHGYVVLGSAFPRADGSTLGIDAGRGSAEDVQFLVRWGRVLSFVDPRHVALVGHSAGAQAMFRAMAQPGCVGDALVLLDTTQDYYALGLPLHVELVRDVTEGVAALTHPMLVAASPEAIFALCDTLVNAERTYFTVPELGHDEFISQGHQRLERIGAHALAVPAEADATEVARTPQVRASYRELCEVVLSFLDAELLDLRADFDARLEHESAWSPARACLVRVPRGTSAPEPYDLETADAPPTPRQFRWLLEEKGAELACAVLERFHDEVPRGPVYTSTMMAGSLLYALAQHGRADEAKLYYEALEKIPLRVLGLYEFIADFSGKQKPAVAREILRFAHELDPDDAGIAARWRKLEEEQAK